jgi:glycosyltransferase involved in cell wall biosynthesis
MPALSDVAASRGPPRTLSVIIPARNAGAFLDEVLAAVLSQETAGCNLEVLVADDGSVDDTALRAAAAGATVVPCAAPGSEGNPAAARNRAAAHARGDILIFLDADRTPAQGWILAMLACHLEGERCIGGSMALPKGLPTSARCDYYCGWYHVHPRAKAGPVRNHPPGNIAVERSLFHECGGFDVRHPIAFSHEELRWQAELERRGHRIWFEPAMKVEHWNRPGWGNLHRRSYRWGYGAIEIKAETGNVRWPSLYRRPALLIAASPVLAPLQAVYVVGLWLRAGVLEPVLMLPAILSARFAYTVGLASGGLRWLARRRSPGADRVRPRWE